jgi:histone H3/H4
MLMIPETAFARLVREIIQKNGSPGGAEGRVSREAVLALQMIAEHYLTHFFTMRYS